MVIVLVLAGNSAPRARRNPRIVPRGCVPSASAELPTISKLMVTAGSPDCRVELAGKVMLHEASSSAAVRSKEPFALRIVRVPIPS